MGLAGIKLLLEARGENLFPFLSQIQEASGLDSWPLPPSSKGVSPPSASLVVSSSDCDPLLPSYEHFCDDIGPPDTPVSSPPVRILDLTLCS